MRIRTIRRAGSCGGRTGTRRTRRGSSERFGMLIGGLLTRRGTKKANRDAVSLRLTEKYLGEVATTRCVDSRRGPVDNER